MNEGNCVVPRRLHHVRQVWARQAFVPLLCLALSAYFAAYAVNGRHGLAARSKLEDRAAALAFERETLEAARARLARDVALLGPGAPDPDLVEEIARDVLGFAYPEDRILLEPKP